MSGEQFAVGGELVQTQSGNDGDLHLLQWGRVTDAAGSALQSQVVADGFFSYDSKSSSYLPSKWVFFLTHTPLTTDVIPCGFASRWFLSSDRTTAAACGAETLYTTTVGNGVVENKTAGSVKSYCAAADPTSMDIVMDLYVYTKSAKGMLATEKVIVGGQYQKCTPKQPTTLPPPSGDPNTCSSESNVWGDDTTATPVSLKAWFSVDNAAAGNAPNGIGAVMFFSRNKGDSSIKDLGSSTTTNNSNGSSTTTSTDNTSLTSGNTGGVSSTMGTSAGIVWPIWTVVAVLGFLLFAYQYRKRQQQQQQQPQWY